MSDKDFYLQKLRATDSKLQIALADVHKRTPEFAALAEAVSYMLEVLEKLTGIGSPPIV